LGSETALALSPLTRFLRRTGSHFAGKRYRTLKSAALKAFPAAAGPDLRPA
jgi:hypothetical protein